ncbi:hypothetical protein [Xanthomonas hydrangeae]|uniref:hypothetical protein n=1 Tax=Xanthomonas hydrangeae TaxID=2775159 RepID=UPI003517A360
MAGGLRDCLRGFRVMRWLARVFASAIARRVAYTLVALLFAALGARQAGAQDYSNCTKNTGMETFELCNDQGRAVSAASSVADAVIAEGASGYGPGRLVKGAMSIDMQGRTVFFMLSAPSGGGVGRVGRTWPVNGQCSNRQDYNGVFPGNYGAPKSGSVQCNGGCMQVWTPNADGTWNGTFGLNATCDPMDDSVDQCKKMGLTTGYHYNNYTATCEPDTKECPEGQQNNAKGECEPQKCPNGMTLSQLGTCENEKNECPAGQTKAPDGSCTGDENQCGEGKAMGKDGTCKRDADGDGKPDEGEDEGDSDPTFAGGDSCDSPPACSGDVILCGQARIQWRIDCNTRRDVNIQGGTCSSPPVCIGKNCRAMEYAGLLMQWRTACALEKANTGSGSGDNADVKAIRDAITGTNGQANIGEEGTAAGAFSDESGYGQGGMPDGKLDTSGFGYSRSCPTVPDVSVFGQTIHFDTSKMCQWMVLGGQIVLVMAALASLRLMSQGGA